MRRFRRAGRMGDIRQIRDKETLAEYVGAGHKVKYVFFWGHQRSKTGISASCFSQWYAAPFSAEGRSYATAEHFMMAEKARLFNDPDALEMILAAKSPGEAKSRGRNVRGFDEQIWIKRRFDIVVAANKLKFSQNSDLLAFLLGSGQRVLVEASPVDKIWGIGLEAKHPHAENPRLWKGLNLLGFALMEVRAQFGT
jgi:ribA/ribD-fused uncharacterized protein